MKSLIAVSVLFTMFPTNLFAVEGKCYQVAKKAAFNYAKSEEILSTKEEFNKQFSNEYLEIVRKNATTKEFWSFGDGSMFIGVEVDVLSTKCNVKSVGTSQDDQD